MKKTIITISFIFILLSLHAQKIDFGAKLGVNFTNLTGDISNNSMKTGFHIGGLAEFYISENFSFQPELLYSTQGYKGESTVTNNFTTLVNTTKLKLNYLNLPILAKYYVADKFSLEAGPQIGFLLSAKRESTTFNNNNDSNTVVNDVAKDLKGIDLGLVFGLGYILDKINFNARYILGLSNIDQNSQQNNLDIKHSVFQLSVGYFFK